MGKMAYSQAYRETRRRQTFQRATALQGQLLHIFPGKTKHQIKLLVSNTRRFNKKINKKVSPESIIVMKIIEKNNINSDTAYRWLRFLEMPEDLKMEAEKGLITNRKAMRITANKRNKEQVSKNWRFIQESRQIIKEVLSYA